MAISGIVIIPDEAVDQQKPGFQFYFLISSLRPHSNNILIFNHAAEGQHQQNLTYYTITQVALIEG